MYTVMFKMDNQQDDRIGPGTLLNVMCQPGWEGGLGENGCMYTHTHIYIYIYTESLCYPPETITTLLIQDKMFLVLKKC